MPGGPCGHLSLEHVDMPFSRPRMWAPHCGPLTLSDVSPRRRRRDRNAEDRRVAHERIGSVVEVVVEVVVEAVSLGRQTEGGNARRGRPNGPVAQS